MYRLLERESLNEASLGRLFQHITNKTAFGVITAFRGENTLKENRKRNEKLEADIKSLRFGFNKVKGYYVEGGKNPVAEESYIVYSAPGRDKELFDFLKSACKEFDQDSILLVTDGEASLYFRNGDELNLGAFHPNPSELGQAYSKLKGKPFRFGDPYYEEEPVNECVLCSCPAKKKSDSMSDFVAHNTLRRALKKYGKNFYEGIKSENREIQERRLSSLERDSLRPKKYYY